MPPKLSHSIFRHHLIHLTMNASLLRNIFTVPARHLLPVLLCGVILCACDDDTSQIGPGLTIDDTSITLDSMTYNLETKSVAYDRFDARTGNLMLGSMDVKEYGNLNCSFVTRFMCATELNVPDSLLLPERVDSCKLRLAIARGDITGDSLAPQKIAAYRLTKPLPAGITNEFNPEGYYDPASPLGMRSYTTSLISDSDSAFLNIGEGYSAFYVDIPVKKELGQEIFTQYKEHPEVFQWPQTFSEYFPGIYVNPVFGKGCVANIQSILFAVYYHALADKTTVTDGDTIKTQVHSPAIVYPFSSSPEVLSSNNISYKVSDYIQNLVAAGETVVTTPGGYLVNLKFPAQDLVNRYNSSDHNLSMVNDLHFTIPAEVIGNDYGIGATPSLMLIKTSEMEDFFNNNKLPDNKTSFTASYDSTNKKYTFSSMRQYILDMIAKGTVTDEDTDFTLVPVEITSETQTNTYYGTSTSYVTKCTPYTSKPTMTRLLTDEALIVFSFSSQYIK